MRLAMLLGVLLASTAYAAPSAEVVSRSPPVLPREAYSLPPGSNHLCKATVTINPNGVPSDVQVANCDPLFFPAMKSALMLWRWRVRAFDEPIPALLDVVVEWPFHVPELPSQTPTRVIRVPDSDGVSNTAVADEGSSNVVHLGANALTELTLEEALAKNLLTDHPVPALRSPLKRACTATVTFGEDGVPVTVSAGDCPPEAGADITPGLWRWRAVPSTQGSSRRVKVLFVPG